MTAEANKYIVFLCVVLRKPKRKSPCLAVVRLMRQVCSALSALAVADSRRP